MDSLNPKSSAPLDGAFGARLENARVLRFRETLVPMLGVFAKKYGLALHVRDAGDVCLTNKRYYLRFHLRGPLPEITISFGHVFFGIPLFPFGRDFERFYQERAGAILIGLAPTDPDELSARIATRLNQIESVLFSVLMGAPGAISHVRSGGADGRGPD